MTKYNKYDQKDIERFAGGLVGKTFADILKQELSEDSAEYKFERKKFDKTKSKGGLGELVEKFYFDLEINNDSEPDFKEAKLELKVSPYVENKNGSYSAGERLVIGMIPNREPIISNYLASKLLQKMESILFVFYKREKNMRRTEFVIDYTKLIKFTDDILKEDLRIIQEDYKIITDKIIQGKAHELSESDTMYLGACTKGSTAKASLQPQYYNKEVGAKRRAFSLKQGYMTYLLNQYIVKNEETFDDILPRNQGLMSSIELQNMILAKFDQYIGKSENDFLEIFPDLNPTSKALFSNIGFRMLGVRSNKARELIKTDTVLKTIRVEENSTLKESMSFPSLSFKYFAKEQWDDSDVFDYFSTKKFLFVVWKKKGESYYFKGVKFWNMSMAELEGDGKRDWLSIQKVIKEGVEFRVKGNIVYNNIPGSNQTSMFHLRPHTGKSAYLINSTGFKKGDIAKHGDVLPNGDVMTIQSFWVNKKYIKKQISELL